MKIHWVATVDDQHRGFGRVSQETEAALRRLGVDMVGTRSLEWDARVLIGGAHAWIVPTPQRDLFWHTCFEADPVPPHTTEILNRAAGVWLPNEWNRELYERNGLETEILVAPYAVNQECFGLVNRKASEQPYTFLWVGNSLGDGSTWGGRKGGELVVRAFQKLGLKDARLVLKVTGDSGVVDVKIDGLDVTMIPEILPMDKYVALLGVADCLVYPSRGEGFGLIPLEAMATGLPTIATHGSGMTDFAREPYALPIPTRGKAKAKLFERVYGHECYWDEIDFNDVADRMRWAYGHRSEMLDMGRKAASWVKATYSWDRTAMALESFMQDVLSGG